MPNKILFSPKEGTTGFFKIEVPEKPDKSDFGHPEREGFRITEFFRAEEKYEKALESCKSNSLEIVNPELLPQWDLVGKGRLILDGDLFDLPEGYEFKDGCTNFVCEAEGKCECSGKRVLRLVKTEEETTKVKMTNPFDVDILTWGGEVIKPGETKMVDVPVVNTETIKKMVSQYTPEELERRENHVATPTFPELEKAIENLTEEDMRKMQERVNKYLNRMTKTETKDFEWKDDMPLFDKKIDVAYIGHRQPEPEESQEELAGEIVNAIWNLCEDSSHLHCVNYIKEKYLIQRKKQ